MNELLKEAVAALSASEVGRVLDLESAKKWTYGDVVELFWMTVNETRSSKDRKRYPIQAAQHEHVLEVRRFTRERVTTMLVTPEVMIDVACMMSGRRWRVGREAEVFLNRIDAVLGQRFDLWSECLGRLLKDADDLRYVRLIVDHVARQVVNTAKSAKDLEQANKLVGKMKQVQQLLLDKAIAYAADLEKRPARSIEFVHPLL